MDKVPYAIGKKGTFVFDVDPNRDSSPGYKIGNDWMRSAEPILMARGFDVILDQTAAFLTNNENVSGYTSWGSNDASYPTNSLLNPGFENDGNGDGVPDNWYFMNDTGVGSVSMNDTDMRNGAWSVRITRNATNQNSSYVAQNYTVKAGTRYYAAGFANLTNVSSDMGAHLQIKAHNSGGTVVKYYNGSARTGTTTDWVSLAQVIYEPLDGIINISIGAAFSKSNGTVFFDDLRLYEIKPHNSWLPGALAETYVSTGGRSFNYGTNYGQSLVVDLILDGVTGVKGYVYEPYLTACAHPDILFNTYTQGYYLAESYHMASQLKGWMGVVVGDPKLAPYRQDIIPDLAIYSDNVSFSDNNPTTEDIVDIYADVYNHGNFTGVDVEVEYYAGNPFGGGTLLGSSLLDVAPHDHNLTSFSWNTTGFSGTYDIYVFVDAIDRVYELNEFNNLAFALLNILEKGTRAPELINILAAPNPQENGGYVNITVDVSDDIWIDEVWINITHPDSSFTNVSMTHYLGYQWFRNASYWELGNYSNTIWAKDNIDNWNSSIPEQFTIWDKDGPWLTDLKAIPNLQQSGDNVNISVNATDDISVYKVWINLTFPNGTWVNTSMAQGIGPKWFYNTTYIYPGDYLYNIWANDTSNNWASDSDTFSIQDQVPPEITNIIENPGMQEAGGYVNITANVTDNVEVDEVWVNITGVGNFSMKYDVLTGKYFFNSVYILPITYDHTIWANDTSNNWNSSSSSFLVIDTKAPLITNLDADPNPLEAGQFINISANITDEVGVAEVRLNIIGVGNFSMSYDPVAGLYFYRKDFSNLGNYVFRIWTVDNSGNGNSTDSSFQVVDTQPPMITEITAQPNPQESGGIVNISVKVTDIIGVDEVWINIDGIGNFSMEYHSSSGLYFHFGTFTHPKTYLYTIWAMDTSNNWNLTQSSFIVDDSIPPVSNPGSDMTIEVGTEVTLNGSASYDNSGAVANYTWTIIKRGDEYAKLYGESPTFIPEEPGEYQVILTVFDGSGLYHQDSIKIIVNPAEQPDDGTGDYWWIILIVIIVIIVAVVISIIISKRKKKHKESSDVPSSEDTEQEESD